MLPQSNRLMGNELNLYGASGHCKVVIDILRESKKEIHSIIDDDVNKKELHGILVLHSSLYDLASKSKVIVTIGDNTIRKMIVEKIKADFDTAMHPKAIVSRTATIGCGTVLLAGAIVNADAIVGNHCIINTGSIIEHDCIIGDYVHVSPNATLSGSVIVNEGVHIGVGACVIQGVTIGKWAIVGAGAVILKDVPDFAVVVGNPGRIIKSTR